MQEKNDGKFIKGLFCGVLLVLCCMGASIAVYRWQWNQKMEKLQQERQGEEPQSELGLDHGKILDKIERIEDIINEKYYEKTEAGQIENGIYRGMVAGLEDPYAEYYTAQELQRTRDSVKGVYAGIGCLLAEDHERQEIVVKECFEGQPAQKAGMQAGDILRAINGEELAEEGIDLNELVRRVQNSGGERLAFTVERAGERLVLEIQVGTIEAQTVESEMLAEDIGYLAIYEFDSVTEEQFSAALQSLEDAGMEKLIIDLRGNPGGILQVTASILDLLLPEGRIVYTENKNGIQEEYFSDAAHQFTKPLAVLIDEQSASASEVFAGAIRDYGIGTLVGKTTFGKGIVQQIHTFPDGTGIKLTVAKYYTPDGHDIHGKGIAPDVETALNGTLYGMDGAAAADDDQLQAAVRILQNEN